MKISLKLKVTLIAFAFTSPLIVMNPAYAASTALTFTVVSGTPGPALGGALTISAPATLDLLTYALPYTFTTTFPSAITVTDLRVTSAGWSSSVLMSPLTPTAGGTAIPATVFSYNPGSITKTGAGTTSPSIASNPSSTSLVVTATPSSGNISATWIPTITTTILNTPATGDYTGYVTSSVL